MTLADHEAVVELLSTTPGVTLRQADSREATRRYLERNPGLSLVCEDGGRLVGCLMAGHDGRRGYRQHLVVRTTHRRQAIAEALVERTIHPLRPHGRPLQGATASGPGDPDPRPASRATRLGIDRGWQRRDDIDRYSHTSSGDQNA